MTYEEFTNKLGTLAKYVEHEKRLQELGIDLSGVTDELINDYVHLLTFDYPKTAEVIPVFIWELEFGERWHPGFCEDAFGRDVRLNTCRGLWDHCERWVDKEFFNYDHGPDERSIVCCGRYHSIRYYICWNGFNWTAYIDLSGTRFIGSKNIVCHGGVTYAEKFYPFEQGDSFSKDRWIVGWDYAHNDDMTREWSVDQIRREIFQVIERLEKIPY